MIKFTIIIINYLNKLLINFDKMIVGIGKFLIIFLRLYYIILIIDKMIRFMIYCGIINI